MKRIFTVVMIPATGVLSITSCQKNNHRIDTSSHYCTCGYKGVSGDDTLIIKRIGYGAIFSADKAKTQCDLQLDTLQITYPNIDCTFQ
jgi:hypothetical protein